MEFCYKLGTNSIKLHTKYDCITLQITPKELSIQTSTVSLKVKCFIYYQGKLMEFNRRLTANSYTKHDCIIADYTKIAVYTYKSNFVKSKVFYSILSTKHDYITVVSTLKKWMEPKLTTSSAKYDCITMVSDTDYTTIAVYYKYLSYYQAFL